MTTKASKVSVDLTDTSEAPKKRGRKPRDPNAPAPEKFDYEKAAGIVTAAGGKFADVVTKSRAALGNAEDMITAGKAARKDAFKMVKNAVKVLASMESL